MRLTLTAFGRKQIGLGLTLRDLTLWLPRLQISLYWCPVLSDKGLVACWRQRSAYYARGFVLRVLWLGFIVRQGKPAHKGKPAKPSLAAAMEAMFGGDEIGYDDDDD